MPRISHITSTDSPCPPKAVVRLRDALAGPGVSALFPLDFTYTEADLDPPAAHVIGAADVPPAYASLLVHDNEMTKTLEQHFGGRVSLSTLWSHVDEPWFARRVLLTHDRAVVEVGAICLRLDAFEPAIRSQIESGAVPLGRILREGIVSYTSEGRAYFAATPNADLMRHFEMREPATVYGRSRTIFLQGRKVGDVTEVLPPL